MTEGGTTPRSAEMAGRCALPELIPRGVSVRGYAELGACTYHFIARDVLGLGEMDEVREEELKGD